MSASVVNLAVSKTILKPVDLVRRQFMDIEHHIKVGVHPRISYVVHSQTEEECHFRLETKVLGMMQADENVLRRMPDGTVVSEVLSGSNVGMRIVHVFEPQGPQATIATLKLQIPVSGIKKLFKPFFAVGVRRTVARALEEDRRDLEERGYPSPSLQRKAPT
jgi:hypothetical protein